ncbi:hypothetical protein Q9L58_010454 [Maublancomyces gigas]|uniref:Uncharacterized protein n=1 Tax=Discina gigas TaxID=1032678 RepID=A0ABR3G422_9PEZI
METTAAETSTPGGKEVAASNETAPSPKESGEQVISGDMPTGAPETNEVREALAEEEDEEENVTLDCGADFDPLADYAQGAEPTAHCMICVIPNARAPITTRLEQADLAIISICKTIANQSSAIPTLTAEVKIARITPPPPASSTSAPPQKKKHNNTPPAKAKGKNQ